VDLTAIESVIPLLAKQVLSQLSYTFHLARVGRPSGSSFVRLCVSEATAALSAMLISRMTRARPGWRRRSSMTVMAALSPSSFR
jgi:hypothetical protein